MSEKQTISITRGLDPSGIEARIAKLTEEISVLESEVDFTLSESNAKTLITI